ncbi:MAG: hypothetical protein CM1200mP36_05570 [Gammaproteobacteria bacterium]|nr:MAG: hypothetical protein CM1200mP36_05570 [Gammaproteobacteria bacterium]
MAKAKSKLKVTLLKSPPGERRGMLSASRGSGCGGDTRRWK